MVGMRIIAGLYLFISFSCLPSNDIKLLIASSQKFEGGREESGSGVHYRIKLIANKSSEKLEIVAVWVGQKKYKPRIIVNSGLSDKSEFRRGDTLLLSFTNWTHKPETMEAQPENWQNDYVPPQKIKGEGMIEARFKKKTFFKEIPQFIKLDPKVYR